MLRLRTLGGVWLEDATGGRVSSPRPRRIALLLLVAASGRRGISRNRVRAIFWPDTDDDRAKHALSQTIYALRRDLDRATIQGEGDLRLDPAIISCDVTEFREALAAEDPAQAYALYRGLFGAGFSVEDAPEFERWLDEERGLLAREAAAAFEILAGGATTSGDHRRAAEIWRHLATLDPLSPRIATSYMSALAAAGDREAAMAHAGRYAAHLKRELEVDPDPSVVRLMDQLRGQTRPSSAAPSDSFSPRIPPMPVDEARSVPVGEVRPPSTSVESRAPEPSRLMGWAVALALIVVAASFMLVPAAKSRASLPVLAVGEIRDLTAPDSARVGGVLSEVLATSLARLNGIDVIANSRIIELLADGADTVRSARTDATRRAGATEILEGELMPAGPGRVRLNLRRVTIERGAVRAGYSVTGSDRLALLDSVTALIAADFRIVPPVGSLAQFTARSPIALRLYEEGLRDYYQSDLFAAEQLFQEALAEDSTFALAAFYAYRASHRIGKPDTSLMARALRLASRATDRDRLLIVTSIGREQNDPGALAMADSLLARFPRDPEAVVTALDPIQARRALEAREYGLLERAIAIDSATQPNSKAPCRLCEELNQLMTSLKWVDSGDAAERALRRYTRLRPNDVTPWRELAMQQFYLGRYEAGAALFGRVATLRPELNFSPVSPLFYGRLLTGRLDEADADCEVQLRGEDPRLLEGYRWNCILVWRYQGRYRAALGLVVSGRLPDGTVLKRRPERDQLNEAVLDLEMGRPRLALRALESLAPNPKAWTPGWYARQLTWNLGLRGTAAIAAGEYELGRQLADSAEVIGQRSLYGRDPILHFFLRGMLAAASGDHQSAVDLFRRSIYSPNFGYTRANLELARSLMALGRAQEAVPALQSSLRGGWDGSNLFVSRTELHELLAQAFAASGVRDSAAAHYRLVERAWRRADPAFLPRYQAARSWLLAYQPPQP